MKKNELQSTVLPEEHPKDVAYGMVIDNFFYSASVLSPKCAMAKRIGLE